MLYARFRWKRIRLGQVNVLLNPSPQVASVTNTSTTGGGGDIETDDHLRARIQAAPNRFSVAGPSGAYRFFALGVDPSIIDVLITTPAPGQVSVYVLTGPITAQPAASPNSVGIAPPALLAAVLSALSATTVRPLTDTVNAFAVSEVDYQITGTVELYADANVTATMAAVNAAAAQFAVESRVAHSTRHRPRGDHSRPRQHSGSVSSHPDLADLYPAYDRAMG